MNRAIVASVLIAAVGLGIAASRHNDDGDAVLYTVVSRNMVRDGTWFDLQYTPNVHAHFREHLPFGFWPSAVVVRVAGEAALPWLGVVWSLLTVALVAEVGRRLGAGTTGALAALILGTTEQFVVNGAAHRLDPPLVLFALLAAAPALVAEKRSWKAWLLMTFAAALAALVKGPFGLVPLVGAIVARALIDRDFRWLFWGAAATVVAVLPVLGFLLHERALQSDWWSGYVEAQILASATGARTDGNSSPLYPLESIGARFWPWLPFVALGLWGATRSGVGKKNTRLVVVWLLLCTFALMLPSRKLWHHVLILFPALALVAALGLRPLVDRHRLTSLVVAAVVAIGTLGFVAVGHRGRTVACTDFAAELNTLAPNAVVIVGVTEQKSHWREIGVVAKEFRLRPWMVGAATAMDDELGAQASLALVPETWGTPSGWREVKTARGWRLLRR